MSSWSRRNASTSAESALAGAAAAGAAIGATGAARLGASGTTTGCAAFARSAAAIHSDAASRVEEARGADAGLSRGVVAAGCEALATSRPEDRVRDADFAAGFATARCVTCSLATACDETETAATGCCVAASATRATALRGFFAALLVFVFAFAGFTAGFFVAFAAAVFAGFLLPAAFAARGFVAGFFLAAVLLFVFVMCSLRRPWRPRGARMLARTATQKRPLW